MEAGQFAGPGGEERSGQAAEVCENHRAGRRRRNQVTRN